MKQTLTLSFGTICSLSLWICLRKNNEQKEIISGIKQSESLIT